MKATIAVGDRLICACGKGMLLRWLPKPPRTVVYCPNDKCEHYNLNFECPTVELERSK